jgi:hypothetical protein
MKDFAQSHAPTFAAPGITRPLVDLVGCAVAQRGGEQTKEMGNVQCDEDCTFRCNHPQHRLFGRGGKQAWS